MSQNDFTIANQGFPAFRADLNSALQALASNNSGATEPSTMFANMWWYDSANNIMYIRNEDNDAWIKFAELDQANDKFVLSGTLQLDDGTVSAPALTFNSDTNMGIYRGGTDILKFVTAGTDAVTIDASQQVGIGISSPRAPLHIQPSGGASDDFNLLVSQYRPNIVLEDITVSSTDFQLFVDDNDLQFRYGDASTDTKLANEAMRISNGNVGIGVTPSFNLHVFQSGPLQTVLESDTGNSILRITSGDGDSAQIFFGDQTNDTISIIKHDNSDNSLAFFTSGSNKRMHINSSGGVEIGTYSNTGATRGFIVDPSINANGYRIRSSVLTSLNLAHYQFANTNGIVGAIRTTGTATAYDTSSDHRLKENITADWDATTRLKQLNPVRFNFIADADTTVDGFLAHEVQSVVPEAISGTHNEVEVWQDGEELPDGVSVGDNKLDEDGNTIPVYQGIDQSKLVPLLVKTIQELEARIVALETA
jgi:hypothetical protein